MTTEIVEEPSRADELTGVRRWLTSTLLIIFTMLIAAVCIILLSSTLTQSRLTNLGIDGVEMSLRNLDNIGQQWAKERERQEQRSQALEEAENNRLSLLPESTKAGSQFVLAKQEMEGLLAGFYFRILPLEPELAKLIHNQGYEDQVGKILGAKEQLHTKHGDLDTTVTAIESQYKRYRAAYQRQAEAKANIAGPEKQIALLKDQLAKIDGQLDAIFALVKPGLDVAGRARVVNAFSELGIVNYVRREATSSWLHRTVSHMWHGLLTNPDLLTLFLVIFMGVLGSALQITHSYFMKNQAQTIGGYFQRISVGAMTALVIFIVAKAGVPVIADPGRLSGDASINPYFVSFLAIISGLLSENAIANVQTQGAKLFGPGGAGPDRWARADLTAELQAQNLPLGMVARQLGSDETVTAAKLKGLDSVSDAQQKIIALLFRRDVRDIFTDIPPPSKT